MLTSATRGETLTPNPIECNSILTSGTNNIYPYPYIDVSDQGHRLRITHTNSHRYLLVFRFRFVFFAQFFQTRLQ